MNKLVKNELYKIFHKKGIYILFLVFAFLFLLSGVLNKFLNNGVLDSMVMSIARDSLDTYDKDNPEQAAAYVELKVEVDKYDLIKELGTTDSNSPEYYYITNDMSTFYREAYTDKYVKKDEEAALISQKKLDEEIEFVKHFDWKKKINQQLAELEENEELSADTKKEMRRVLQYRLDNNLPYSYIPVSQELEMYIESLRRYETMSKDESTYVTRQALLDKREIEASINVTRYKLDNGLIKNVDTSQGTAQDSFIAMFSNVSLFVIVCILMIAGSILSDEFNKGTIKQLLTRPYSRTKILVSKFIASFVTTIAFIVVCAVFSCLLTGILTGTFGSLAEPIVHYSFNSHEIVTMNTLTESLLCFAGILPQLLILTLFALLISAAIGNTTVSVVLGFVLSFSGGIFQALLTKVKILSFFPIFNWDLNVYFFGGLNPIQSLTFTKAICVDIVTVIGLFILSLIVFKRKDIKNQ